MASTLLYTRARSGSIGDKMLLWYFPIEMIYRFLLLRNIDTHLILPLQAFILIYGFIAWGQVVKNRNFKELVTLYILYSLFSIFFIFIGNESMPGYINDVRVVLLPMFAIFIGMKSTSIQIYRVFIYSVLACMIVGLVLYFVKPAWYIQKLVECWNDVWYSSGRATEDNIMTGGFMWASRFSAIFVTPYAVSYFGTFALCLLTVDIYKDEEHRLIKNRIIQIVSFIILAISAILCQNRVAIVYLIFLILCGLYYGIKNKRSERRIFVYLIAGLTLFISATMIKLAQDEFISMIYETLLERVDDSKIENMQASSRHTQIIQTLESWDNYAFGQGLGSKSGVARSMGHIGVTDNGYVKLLVEQGVIGFVLMFAILLGSMKRAFKYRKYFMAELLILGYVPFTMIGANPLGMEFDYMIIMWLSLGHIWNKRYLDECIVSNNRI